MEPMFRILGKGKSTKNEKKKIIAGGCISSGSITNGISLCVCTAYVSELAHITTQQA